MMVKPMLLLRDKSGMIYLYCMTDHNRVHLPSLKVLKVLNLHTCFHEFTLSIKELLGDQEKTQTSYILRRLCHNQKVQVLFSIPAQHQT